MHLNINTHRKGILFTCFLILFFSIVQAQPSRPKIGLTLSGGGAKGMAHIGILKAIDSAGLKIDCITGTSMGSIMGAMYAAGYSGDSIEKIVRKIDWDLLFSTSPQLNAISIEEKSEYEKYAIEIPLEKSRLKIGKGIITGQELWLKLSEVFKPVYNITDFSKLSIPFKCIGTDLATGNAVVMDHGNIVTAVRASMAIPSVFTPVKYDDKLLIDGGVVNNFPVLDVKKMGADYVIGVNLNLQSLLKVEDLETGLDILFQIAFFKDAANFEKNKAPCNLYIMPDLKGYSAGSFSSADSIIDIGIETGKLFYPYFKKLADSLNAIYGVNKFEKNRLPVHKKINIRKYTVEGLKNTQENFFFGLLGLEGNKNYSQLEMDNAIRRVYGSRYYKIIRYDFLPDTTGSIEMHFTVEENPQTFVKFALNYNNFTKLALKFNLTSRDLLLKESRLFASISFGENPRLYGEYYKYIGRKRTARAVLDHYYEAVDFPVYVDLKLLETFRSFYNVSDFQFQANINRFSYIGVGQQFIYSKLKTKESIILNYKGNNKYWQTYLAFKLNNVDQKYYTKRGWIVHATAGYVYGQKPEYTLKYNDSTVTNDSAAFNNDNYFNININASHFTKLNSRFTWSQHLGFAYIMQKNSYIGNNYVVGGVHEVVRNQVPFVGLNEMQVKTGSIATLQFGLQYKLAKHVYLTGRVNAALYDFYGIDLSKINVENNFLSGYGLTFGYNSLLGPIEFTVMNCDQDSKVRTNINIGFIF